MVKDIALVKDEDYRKNKKWDQEKKYYSLPYIQFSVRLLIEYS